MIALGLILSGTVAGCVQFLPFDEASRDPIAVRIQGQNLTVVSCRDATIKTLFIDVRTDGEGQWIKYLTATGAADVGPSINISAGSLPEGLDVQERADRPFQQNDTINVTMIEEETGRTIGAEFVGTSPPTPSDMWLLPDGSIATQPC